MNVILTKLKKLAIFANSKKYVLANVKIMSNNINLYKKAKTLVEVDNAVRLDVPITPDHEFYTDFSDVRGDFEDRMIYKTLNVHPKTFVFNRASNQGNKVVLFLAGMRGSGKTSELAKIAKKLNKDRRAHV